MPRSTRAAFAFAASTILLAPAAYLAAFSGFASYDDEGYFLLRLRDFAAGPDTFSHVSAMYGPVYYELVGGFFKLTGLPITHDNGRYVTIAIWLGASLLQGLAAYRLTRRLWLGVVAQLVSFHVLAALAPEPLHPSGLVALFISGIALAASFDETRPRSSGAAIGALCAALCLVKVNTGLFALLALALAWSGMRRGWTKKWVFPSVGGVLVLLPAQLMWGLIGTDWVLQLAVLVTASVVTVYFAAIPELPASPRVPGLLWIAAGLAVVGLVGVVAIYPFGWSPENLVAGLRQAARLPQIFVWPAHLNWGYAAWAILVVILMLLARLRVRAEVRVVAGVFTLALLLFLPSALFLLALPLAWLVIAGGWEQGNSRFARLLLAALAVVESLQVYPVAGMQLSLAGLGLVPLAALMISDGLPRTASARAQSRSRWLAPSMVGFAMAILGLNAFFAASDYRSGVPAGLPGMNATRLPSAQAGALRSTTQAVEADCSEFITYPGLLSFYVWTGKAPPVPLDAGPWMLVLDDATQRSMVETLRTVPRLCVIEDQALVDFWAQGRPVPDRALVRYIESDFTVVATFGDYRVLVAK